MSASPAEPTPGRTPNGTNLPPIRRPKPNNDPLVRPKRRQRPVGAAAGAPRSNGGAGPARPGATTVGKSQPLVARPAQIQNPAHHVTTLGHFDAVAPIPSGFSSEPLAPYTDYPLFLTKRQLKEEIRTHVARFYSKKTVDPRLEDQFTRPVRLSRRDARSLNAPKEGEDGKAEIDEDEKEKWQIMKAQREAEREAAMAEQAPSASSGGQRRVGSSSKKTQQVFRHDQTEEQRARTKLRYEEALQWHLEDFDNKQSWVGNYEAALSESYASMVFQDGKFHITPLEKWYKFTPRLNHKTMALEDAEKEMLKYEKEPEWIKKVQEQGRDQKLEEMNRQRSRKLYVGSIVKEDPDGIGSGARGESGFDELDFEEDRFADDEEPDLFEGDADELKQTEERIKRDQLQANIFNMKDESSYDRADVMEKKAKLAEREHGKRVKKALKKRERNFVYDSDSDANPYSDKSETTDSEAERQKEEQQKKEAEEKAKSSQQASGTSTKGSNTPSNRASKHPDRLKPGSANASDASGNESSRKKAKKVGGSKLGTGTNTPNGQKSRSRSPAPATLSSQEGGATQKKTAVPSRSSFTGPDALKKRPRGSGSGSDGEGAGSGGEMSDVSRKRLKLNVRNPASAAGSPGTSRSPSVEPSARAGSPGQQPSQSSRLPPMPTATEILAAIPDTGIPMVKLFRMYGGQDKDRKQDLIRLLKPISRYDAGTKMLKKVNRNAS